MLDIDPDTVTTEDLSSLRYVCEVVSRRASFMASAGITALLKKMDYKDVTIAIDGSLFRYFDIDNYKVLWIFNGALVVILSYVIIILNKYLF